MHGDVQYAREARQEAQEEAARLARIEERRLAAIQEENRVRDQALLDATHRIVAKHATQVDVDLILSQLISWKGVLSKLSAIGARYLMDNVSLFPIEIQNILLTQLPLLKLKTFSFTDGLVTREELSRLLAHAHDAFLSNSIQSSQISSLFLIKLAKFLNKLNDESLSDKQVLCLKRIVKDYQINLLGTNKLIDNIVISQLSASETLSQLNPRPEITNGMGISVENFPAYLGMLRTRVALLPLNDDNKETMRDVILPGIAKIIDDEQTIVDHVRDHYGVLYYLNDKLPLHTTHVESMDPEEYRQILHRLLVDFFGAAEIAYNQGRLDVFCEKICFGYCFEGRVSEAFDWAASISEIRSFDDLMARYIHKEYLPYAEIMSGLAGDLYLADPITDFIMTRHRNDLCIHNEIYAPKGKVTVIGVKKYLAEVLSLIGLRDCERALRETRPLLVCLEKDVTLFWNRPWQNVIQAKIDALNAFNVRILTSNELPSAVATSIKRQYPLALNGIFTSRTKKILDQFEADNEDSRRCGL